MSKIKKLFGAGDSQDDEIMYGAAPRKQAEPASPTSPSSASKLSAERDSKASIDREVTPQSEPSAEAGKEEKPALIDSSSPSSKKDSEQSQKSAETSDPSTEKSPEKSAAASAIPGTTISRLKETDQDSALSVKSGVVGPYATTADGTLSEQTNTGEVGQASEGTTAGSSTADSHIVRDAAIGAGVVGAGGAAAAVYASDSQPKATTSKPEGTSKAVFTEWKSRLPNLSTHRPSGGLGTSDSLTPDSKAGASSNASGSKAGAGSNLGRDAAIAGTGAGLAGAGAYAATSKNENVTPETSAKDIQKPEQVDSASRLAPHVPGEFPTESGEDPHHVPGGYPATPGESQPEATPSKPKDLSKPVFTEWKSRLPSLSTHRPSGGLGKSTSLTSDSKDGSSSSGLGTGAAVGTAAAVGAGVTAAGIFQATKSDGTPSDSKIWRSTESTQHEHHFGRPESSPPAPPTEPVPNRFETSSSGPQAQGQHNYGRDAAIVGGAGLAGVVGAGAYETLDRRDTGPASKTIGPHESNIKNILDPRVKPDPALQKELEPISSGPHQSDIANIIDPRVKDSSPKPQGNETHYGRDAAIVGGAGAAGAGAAYAATSEKEGSPSPSNKVSTDSSGHSHLHKKKAEQQGEKKQGFLSKILHRKKDKDDSSPRGSQEQTREAEPAKPSGEETAAGAQDMRAHMLPVDERGLITLVNEGAHPDAPDLVVHDPAAAGKSG